MITKKNLMLFKRAKEVAEKSDYCKTHIGAIAVYKGDIIGVGYNTYKTHPLQKKYDKYRNLYAGNNVSNMHAMHAELMCLASIKKTDIDWSKVDLYVYRKRYDNHIMGMCRPCPACMRIIRDYGIKHIYYTTNESFAYEYLIDEEK